MMSIQRDILLPNIDQRSVVSCLEAIDRLLTDYGVSLEDAETLWHCAERAASTWLARNGHLPQMDQEQGDIGMVTRRVELVAGDEADDLRYVAHLGRMRSTYGIDERDRIGLHTAHMLVIAGRLIARGSIPDLVTVITPGN